MTFDWSKSTARHYVYTSVTASQISVSFAWIMAIFGFAIHYSLKFKFSITLLKIKSSKSPTNFIKTSSRNIIEQVWLPKPKNCRSSLFFEILTPIGFQINGKEKAFGQKLVIETLEIPNQLLWRPPQSAGRKVCKTLKNVEKLACWNTCSDGSHINETDKKVVSWKGI